MAKKKSTGPVNVQFADRYEGCQVVANIMNLNVETVRKRAKAGKIPAKQDAKGTWIFVHADLVAAGIKPFDGPIVAPGVISTGGPLPLQTKRNVTEVIFVLDRSGSMSGLIGKARDNLQAQLDQLRAAAGPNDVYNVSVINFDDSIMTTLRSADITSLGMGAHSLYMNPNGNTRLYDAVAAAIDLASGQDDGQKAFLISVVTDGAENSSRKTSYQVATQVQLATGKDRYTFVYAGPRGSEYVGRSLGIPDGNITTWEQTYAGTVALGRATGQSLGTYTRSRSAGVMKSTSFYAQPVTTDASKFAGQLDNSLQDVTSEVQVQRVTDKDPVVISKFCDKKFGRFEKGKYFYQLTESEKVQDYKKVVIQDTTTGAFYSGWGAAKKLLGIPDFQGTVHIKPGNLGDFKVFVQSTSVNRKLVPGTAVVYLP